MRDALGRRRARDEQHGAGGEGRDREARAARSPERLLEPDAPPRAQCGAPLRAASKRRRRARAPARAGSGSRRCGRRAAQPSTDLAREPRREQQHHRGLEDAEPARHVAHEARDLGEQEDGPSSAGEAEPGGRREQHVEDARRRAIQSTDESAICARVIGTRRDRDREAAHARARAAHDRRDGHVDAQRGQPKSTPSGRVAASAAPSCAGQRERRAGEDGAARARGSPARTSSTLNAIARASSAAGTPQLVNIR